MLNYFIVKEKEEQEKYDAYFIENNLKHLQNQNKLQSIKNNCQRQTLTKILTVLRKTV